MGLARTANRIIAIVIILIFLLELFILVFLADFTNNRGASKGIAIFYFCLFYVWLVVPSLIFLLLNKKIKKQKIVNWIFLILNSVILVYNIPMFIEYLKGI
jgi:hypothetical protein